MIPQPRPAVATLLWLLPVAALAAAPCVEEEIRLPWRQAGWSEAAAAAHLLDRLTFGPRPGDVERVVGAGLESWLAAQLQARLPEPGLEARLAELRSLEMSAFRMAEVYPNPGLVLMEARRQGVIPEELDLSGLRSGEPDQESSREELRAAILDFAVGEGYRSQKELLGEMMTAELLRAVESPNQLREVLADFWSNHFYVSLADPQVRSWIAAFERDAVRPHVLGRFPEMLESTAGHPAMLLYLDNAQSTADPGVATTMQAELEGRPAGRWASRRVRTGDAGGLNENYARELLELHTLGVDGGYTQEDVVAAARAFTGWSIYPPEILRRDAGEKIRRAVAFGVGFVARREQGFLFRADAHDAEAKVFLGNRLPAGRGMEDGLEVLEILAGHPSTARHLAGKLAVRFVSDEPPEALVEELAGVFLESGGDLCRVMLHLVSSPAFWDPASRGEKIKSPFELAVSAVRALDGEVTAPRELLRWVARMGQPLHGYQAPTGYPDRADFWVSTGSLLNRMRFGLELAAGEVPGVRFDLLALNGGREPESVPEALETYAGLLLPQRDLSETLVLLEPMAQEPELARRVEETAPDVEVRDPLEEPSELPWPGEGETRRREGRRFAGRPEALARVVGVILGSPEFQRR